MNLDRTQKKVSYLASNHIRQISLGHIINYLTNSENIAIWAQEYVARCLLKLLTSNCYYMYMMRQGVALTQGNLDTVCFQFVMTKGQALQHLKML